MVRSTVLDQRASRWTQEAETGALKPFLSALPRLDAGLIAPETPPDSQAVVVAAFQLQNAADYRGTIRNWFRPVQVGGMLIIVVPHAFLYERQLALPSRWSAQHRRLYTPRSLMDEIEEALEPNSYRVRHLGDADRDYDYGAGLDEEPVGAADVVVVLEKITQPGWQPLLVSADTSSRKQQDAPDYEFATPRTRVEAAVKPHLRKVLLMKLDHLGDFIMGMQALERARVIFADAEITLVVGSWNAETARALKLADKVIAFDAFPRNSSEEEVDVAGKAAVFQSLVADDYDLAIDLRVDTDTRQLLRLVRAKQRAAIGTRAQFRFLDIFLPIDFTRNEPETAREFLLSHHVFSSQGSTRKTEHQIWSWAETVERDCAIVWGPYHHLRPGRYFFEPYFDVPVGQAGLVMLDVALDAERLAQQFVDAPCKVRLPFTVEEPGSRFEFRAWAVPDTPSLDFVFLGGRLVREGAASVLHQSEYMLLLLELIAIRLARTGILSDVDA